jgi:hypothetical protein
MLLPLTLIAVALVVLALAGYLTAIAWSLSRTCKSVAAMRAHARPLPDKLTTINGGLGALHGGLEAAASHVDRASRVFGHVL